MRREMVAKLQQNIHLVICPSGDQNTRRYGQDTYHIRKKIYKKLLQHYYRINQWPNQFIYTLESIL